MVSDMPCWFSKTAFRFRPNTPAYSASPSFSIFLVKGFGMLLAGRFFNRQSVFFSGNILPVSKFFPGLLESDHRLPGNKWAE